MNDKDFLIKYEDLLNKGYCDCNEMNCIDSNSPRRILNIAIKQQQEIKRLNNIINELEEWLKNIPKYFMDKRSFNDGVLIEKGMQKQINSTLDKLKELKENKQ